MPSSFENLTGIASPVFINPEMQLTDERELPRKEHQGTPNLDCGAGNIGPASGGGSGSQPAGTFKGLGRQSEELVFLMRACGQYDVKIGENEYGQVLANGLMLLRWVLPRS